MLHCAGSAVFSSLNQRDVVPLSGEGKQGVLMKKLIAMVASCVLFSALVMTASAATVVKTVTPANMQGWLFYNDETDVVDNSLGTFVTGPGVAPIGVGSAQISVTGSQRRNLATYQFSGTPLATLTTLKFST